MIVIHPWPQMMPIFDREMPPRFTPAICLHHNFVYISPLWRTGETSVERNFLNVVLDSHATVQFWSDMVSRYSVGFNNWSDDQGLALLTLSWDKNWDSHSPMNGYPSFYPRIALVAPSPGWVDKRITKTNILMCPISMMMSIYRCTRASSRPITLWCMTTWLLIGSWQSVTLFGDASNGSF